MLLWFNWFSRVERDTKCCKQEVAFSLQETSLWWHNNFITTSLQCCCRMTQLSVSLSIQFHPSRFLSLSSTFQERSISRTYVRTIKIPNSSFEKKSATLCWTKHKWKSLYLNVRSKISHLKNLIAVDSFISFADSGWMWLRSNQRANETWTKKM